MTIASILDDPADARIVTFALPDALKPAFAFIPGQYVTIGITLNGEAIRRPYSICSTPFDDGLSIGVRCVADGSFSRFAQRLEEGDVLDVMPPEGRFLAPIGGRHDYLLLAGGSGIAPMMSILRSVLLGEPESRVTLLYANRTRDSIMFRDTLEALEGRHGDRFVLAHLLDEERQNEDLLNGRLDRDKLAAFASAGLIRPDRHDGVYICGPQPMVEEASAGIAGLGVSGDIIHYEAFTAPGQGPSAAKGP